jgi:hypothetical protein
MLGIAKSQSMPMIPRDDVSAAPEFERARPEPFRRALSGGACFQDLLFEV